MSTDLGTPPWKQLEEIVPKGDVNELIAVATELGPRDMARAMSRLSTEEQNRILSLLGPENAAELIDAVSDAQALELVEALPPEDVAHILEEMESNERADLLANLKPDVAAEILNEMRPEAADDARLLSRYPGNVAGGLMIREFLAYPESTTVGEVLTDMRANKEQYHRYSVQYTYVTDDEGTLEGVLQLRNLLLSPDHKSLSEIMTPNPTHVYDDTPLDELEDMFEQYDYLAFPVTDPEHRLLGLVLRSDVEEAHGEQAESDYLKTQGIVGGDELRSMPVLRRSRRRLSWLSVNIGLNIIAASVIAIYTDTLEAVIALAVFLPIISDMSGCSGNQAVAVSMRELTMGVVRPADILYVWGKELAVGVINGIVLGILIAGAAWAWKGNPYLGLVAGTALAANTVVAVSIGGLVPLVLKGRNMDPALASGPILTTVTDMCGFFLVLSLAAALLPYLT